MTLLWILYAVLVTSLLGVAALGAERALRLAGWPARWPWVGAMLGSWYLGLGALLRPAGGITEGALESLLLVATTDSAVTDTAPAVAAAPMAWLSDAWSAWLHSPWIDGVVDLLLTPLPWLPLAWAGAAGLALLALSGAILSLLRSVRTWPPTRVEGHTVRIAPDFGPALVGFTRPWIVLPRWALELTPGELRLVLAHEEEHRRAKDTLLLMAATASVVAAPWNVALWWHLRRLRMAVEVDCDRRVLRGGAPARAYGSLLVSVGERVGRVGLPATALAEHATFLEARLRTMAPGRERGRWWRAGVAALLGCGIAAAACETPVPTRPADGPLEPTPPAFTAQESPEESPGESEGREVPTERDRVGTIVDLGAEGGADPVVYVDGVRTTTGSGALAELDTDRIARIEVLKGEAARAFHGEEESGGAILIETKGATATYRTTAVPPGSDDATDRPTSMTIREIPRSTAVEAKAPAGDTIRATYVAAAGRVEPVRAWRLLDDPGLAVLVDGAEWTGSREDLLDLAIAGVDILEGPAALRAFRDADLDPGGRSRVLRIRTR